MRSLEQLSIFFTLHIDINELGSDKKLHDHTGGDDGTHSKLHDGSFVGGKDDSEPVHGVGSFLLDDTVERNLTADKINE